MKNNFGFRSSKPRPSLNEHIIAAITAQLNEVKSNSYLGGYNGEETVESYINRYLAFLNIEKITVLAEFNKQKALFSHVTTQLKESLTNYDVSNKQEEHFDQLGAERIEKLIDTTLAFGKVREQLHHAERSQREGEAHLQTITGKFGPIPAEKNFLDNHPYIPLIVATLFDIPATFPALIALSFPPALAALGAGGLSFLLIRSAHLAAEHTIKKTKGRISWLTIGIVIICLIGTARASQSIDIGLLVTIGFLSLFYWGAYKMSLRYFVRNALFTAAEAKNAADEEVIAKRSELTKYQQTIQLLDDKFRNKALVLSREGKRDIEQNLKQLEHTQAEIQADIDYIEEFYKQQFEHGCVLIKRAFNNGKTNHYEAEPLS